MGAPFWVSFLVLPGHSRLLHIFLFSFFFLAFGPVDLCYVLFPAGHCIGFKTEVWSTVDLQTMFRLELQVSNLNPAYSLF